MSDKTVFTYNWKNLIRISRNESGEWFFHYTFANIINYIKKDDGSRYFPDDPKDMFELGQIIGCTSESLIEHCKKEF